MHLGNMSWLLACAALLLLHGPSLALNFDDIMHWTGTGSNEAALVIDWSMVSGEGASTVWGYRWEGKATGYDMLHAIVSADDRLYAKLGGTAVVFGLGYDEPGSSAFALDDLTEFDANGIAQSDITDGAKAIDPADRYAEGWHLGYWFYAVADTSPYDGGTWARSSAGFGVRPLSNGSWNGWTFAQVFNVPFYPDEPAPATSLEGDRPIGDYNDDGLVDLADYIVWRNTWGQSVEPVGSLADGNANGLVDAADYVEWKNHSGATSPAAADRVVQVPEPAASFQLIPVFVLLCCRFKRWRD